MDNVSPLKKENEGVSLLERRISSTALKEAKKSTRDFIHYTKKDKQSKRHFDFGSAIELYLITPVEFFQKVAIMDEKPWFDAVLANNPSAANIRAAKIYKDFAAEFEANNQGKLIIPKEGKDSFETIIELDRMAKESEAYDLLNGDYQVAFEWICPRTGLKRYSRPDVAHKEQRILVDIKTESGGDFERACTKFDYWMQAKDQMVGAVESEYMDEVKEYYWFVLGKDAPYFIDIYRVDLDQLLKVEESYWSTLIRLKNDLSGDVSKIIWHNLPIQKISVPNYYK